MNFTKPNPALKCEIWQIKRNLWVVTLGDGRTTQLKTKKACRTWANHMAILDERRAKGLPVV